MVRLKMMNWYPRSCNPATPPPPKKNPTPSHPTPAVCAPRTSGAVLSGGGVDDAPPCPHPAVPSTASAPCPTAGR